MVTDGISLLLRSVLVPLAKKEKSGKKDVSELGKKMMNINRDILGLYFSK